MKSIAKQALEPYRFVKNTLNIDVENEKIIFKKKPSINDYQYDILDYVFNHREEDENHAITCNLKWLAKYLTKKHNQSFTPEKTLELISSMQNASFHVVIDGEDQRLIQHIFSYIGKPILQIKKYYKVQFRFTDSVFDEFMRTMKSK